MSTESNLKYYNPLTSAEGAERIQRALELGVAIALLALPMLLGVPS